MSGWVAGTPLSSGVGRFMLPCRASISIELLTSTGSPAGADIRFKLVVLFYY